MFQLFSLIVAAALTAATPSTPAPNIFGDNSSFIIDLDQLLNQDRCTMTTQETPMGELTRVVAKVTCPKSGFYIDLIDRTSEIPDGNPIFYSDYGVFSQEITFKVNTLKLGRTKLRISRVQL